MNSAIGLIACILGAAVGVFISYSLGLALLGFLLLIGSARFCLSGNSVITVICYHWTGMGKCFPLSGIY